MLKNNLNYFRELALSIFILSTDNQDDQYLPKSLNYIDKLYLDSPVIDERLLNLPNIAFKHIYQTWTIEQLVLNIDYIASTYAQVHNRALQESLSDPELLKEAMYNFKQARVKQILEDKKLNKVEKLYLIEQEKLFGTSNFLVCNIFDSWKDSLRKLLRSPDLYIEDVLDKYLEYYNRHEYISFPLFLENFHENYDEFENIINDKDNALVEALYITRHTKYKDVKVMKSYNEIVDLVYDYCIKNQIVGYSYDW